MLFSAEITPSTEMHVLLAVFSCVHLRLHSPEGGRSDERLLACTGLLSHGPRQREVNTNPSIQIQYRSQCKLVFFFNSCPTHNCKYEPTLGCQTIDQPNAVLWSHPIESDLYQQMWLVCLIWNKISCLCQSARSYQCTKKRNCIWKTTNVCGTAGHLQSTIEWKTGGCLLLGKNMS